MPPTPIHFAAKADLARAVEAWRLWLGAEKRASGHTLDGYGRDLAAFLTFLTGHLGGEPDLAALNGLGRGISAPSWRGAPMTGWGGRPWRG